MTGTSKATKATGSPALAAAHARDEAESLDDRLARLRKENEAMSLELENRVLRRKLGLDERKTF